MFWEILNVIKYATSVYIGYKIYQNARIILSKAIINGYNTYNNIWSRFVVKNRLVHVVHNLYYYIHNDKKYNIRLLDSKNFCIKQFIENRNKINQVYIDNTDITDTVRAFAHYFNDESLLCRDILSRKDTRSESQLIICYNNDELTCRSFLVSSILDKGLNEIINQT